MNLFEAFILGILQGIIEWLPISSEGQTVLLMLQYLHMAPSNVISYAIFLHIGTMLAVLVRFRYDFLSMLSGWNSPLSQTVVIASASTAISAIPLYFFLKTTFTSGDTAMVLIGALLIGTGLLMKFSNTSGFKNLDQITHRDSIMLGLAQGFAILPGISRSGTTIAVLLLRGTEQRTALPLSFLISVPTVLGAILLDIDSIATIPVSRALVMVLTSFIVGYLTLDLLMKFAARVNFTKFCIYLGGFTLVVGLLSLV